MTQKGYRVIAEFSIHPIGEGTSVNRYVRAALAELRKAKGLRLQVTPMATVIEAKKTFGHSDGCRGRARVPIQEGSDEGRLHPEGGRQAGQGEAHGRQGQGRLAG